MTQEISCKQCGSAMRREVRGEHSCAVQLLAVAVFIIGLVLLFLPPIGTIIGILLMLGSLGMGYKRRKVWACKNCGYFFDRM